MTIYRSAAGHREVRAWCEDQLAAWAVPHARRSLETALGETHVVTAGDGPPLVALAGTNFCAATWLRLLEAAATTHTVHAVDLPGQPGLSGEERPRQPAEAYGAWLGEVLVALGRPAPVVLGHSMGAVVALRAAAGGARLRGMVLADPAGLMRLRTPWRVLRATLPWLRRSDAGTSAGLLRTMLAPDAGPPPADLVTWMALVGRHARTSLAPAPVPAPLLERASRVPVHVVSGQHDAFLPAARLDRAAREGLPGANVRIVESAGHLLPHERPQALLDAVLEVERAGV